MVKWSRYYLGRGEDHASHPVVKAQEAMILMNWIELNFLNFRERETHTAHLKDMEAELDFQMAKIESKAKEKARKEYDSEKRELKTKMETELAELQAQLKLFQKVNRVSITSTNQYDLEQTHRLTWFPSRFT